MQIIGLAWGILAIIGAIVAFFPCLGSFNWLNIPFSIIGLIISVIGLVRAEPGKKGAGTVGVVCCSIAIVIGIIRLMMGSGVF
ncbi:MAG: conserved rane protein of unknown function [Deltaproteobacteria bacterium]|jgi:hypothetical protein|nr:conserved rane protein of unknown function [Deltaproteobacteria bacterium]